LWLETQSSGTKSATTRQDKYVHQVGARPAAKPVFPDTPFPNGQAPAHEGYAIGTRLRDGRRRMKRKETAPLPPQRMGAVEGRRRAFLERTVFESGTVAGASAKVDNRQSIVAIVLRNTWTLKRTLTEKQRLSLAAAFAGAVH
jgi:hypothetical protein